MFPSSLIIKQKAKHGSTMNYSPSWDTLLNSSTWMVGWQFKI